MLTRNVVVACLAILCLAILLLGSLAGFLALGMWFPPGEDVPPIEERLACFNDLPRRSRLLITAIRQFEVDHGAPPTGLGALISRYLPVIPDSGVARFPEYEYKVLSKDEQVPVMWYDLRPAPDLAPIERHHGDFGPADHVILLLTIRKDPHHNRLTADGLPRNLGAKPFNAATWRSDRPSRIGMADSLVARYHGKIETRAEALSLLGEPDGEGVMHDTPWELSVSCTWHMWHEDEIIYRPTQKYWSAPGWVFPVEDWLYIRGD